MTLVRKARVKAIHLVFDDGSEEHWTFPDPISAYYKEATNTRVDRDPVKEDWHDHEVRWSSDRKRYVRNNGKGAKGPEKHLEEETPQGSADY